MLQPSKALNLNNLLVAALLPLAFAGCKSINDKSFSSKEYDVSEITLSSEVIETRAYQMQSQICSGQPSPKAGETLPVAVISGLTLLAKEAVAFGKSKLEERAQYLSSDIKLNTRAFLPDDWPSSTDKTNPALSGKSLCLLVVSGTFTKDENDQTTFLNWLSTDSGISVDRLQQYQLAIPKGIREQNDSDDTEESEDLADEGVEALAKLKGNPSFMAEIRITPIRKTGNGDVIMYIATPIFVFYPHPLHQMSTKHTTRDVAINIEVGDKMMALSFDNIKSGRLYTHELLANKYSIIEEPASQSYRALGVTIVEGPDSLPTSGVLKAIAEKDKDLLEIITEKLKTLEPN